ncbi:MAG: hypothetical protein QG597_2891, partial [Actinomycetota bacterium]|nr:hypothetical protein [Actinomycetota bacterium]
MRKLFIAAAGAALLVLAVVSPARAADVSPEAELGFQQISQCLQSRNDLAVLLVVDESGSLQETDPENKRARLLANLVRSLARQAGTPTANGAREINLAVSTFATEYRPLVPWTELGQDSGNSIATQLESEIPALNQGGGTNHPEALAGARNQMAAITAASAAEQPPCQVAIFFTDGVLSVSDVQEENDAAANEMCRPGGVVDGVRRDGINLVSVMLFDPATARAAPTEYAQGRDLLKAAAEGKGGSRTCGTLPIPPAYARGAYLEGGVDKLASLFASAFALSQGATLIALEGSPTTVVIDPG